MGEDPQVGGRFVAAGGDAGQRVEHLGVDFARIGLAGDGVRGVEAHLLGDELFELAHLGVIAVEQLQKLACVPVVPLTLRALQRCDAVLDFGQIEHQVVGPQACPVADGRRLGRLQVREAERRQVAILLGEVGQRDDHRRQPARRPSAAIRGSGSDRCCR